MLMDSESYDAWIEQQTREINNLKNMRKAERERAVKLINEFRGLFKNRKVFHTKIHIRERVMKGFDNLIIKIKEDALDS